MSYDDVVALCGHATESSSNLTGKAFRPFNFSGKGSVSIRHYYEDQGYVVYENNSSYSGGRTVVDVVLDD